MIIDAMNEDQAHARQMSNAVQAPSSLALAGLEALQSWQGFALLVDARDFRVQA